MHILSVSELDLQEFDKNLLTTLPLSGNIPMPTEFNDNMSCFIEFSKYDNNGRYDSLKFCFNDFLHYLNNTVKLLNTRIYDLEEKVKRDNNTLSSSTNTGIDKLRNEMYAAHKALSSSSNTQLCGIWGYNKLINDLITKVNADNDALSSSKDPNGYLSLINKLRNEMYAAHKALSSSSNTQQCGIWGYNKLINDLDSTSNDKFLKLNYSTKLTVTGEVKYERLIDGTITNANNAELAKLATQAKWS